MDQLRELETGSVPDFEDKDVPNGGSPKVATELYSIY